MSSNEVDEIYEKLLKIYEEEGYVNPKAILNYTIKQLMEEGRTREQAIQHLYKYPEEKERLEQQEQEKERLTKEELSKRAQRTTVERLREKIERLTVLFSNGEITEETYKNAVKTIEENINRIQSGKDIPTVKETSLPLVSSEYESGWVERGEPSVLWWLVPFFFGIIGGIMAYVGVKDDDEDMAFGLLVFGIIWTVIGVIVYFFALSYYLSLLFLTISP